MDEERIAGGRRLAAGCVSSEEAWRDGDRTGLRYASALAAEFFE